MSKEWARKCLSVEYRRLNTLRRQYVYTCKYEYGKAKRTYLGRIKKAIESEKEQISELQRYAY